jgi:signal peptidase II
MGRRARLGGLLYAVAAGVYLLDRGTKVWAERSLAGRPPIELVPHVLHLDYTTNSGGAFGVLGGHPWIFFTASLAVSAAIVAGSTRLAHRWTAVGLGLVLGGAMGNLTDRLIHGAGVSGPVTDFVDLRVWPVFNLADSAIVLGAAVLILAALVAEGRRARDPGPEVVGPT